MMINRPGLLIVIVEYGETNEEAVARVKKEHPGFKGKEQDVIFLVNYGSSPIPNIDSEIKAEEAKINELKSKTKKTSGPKKRKKTA